MTIQYLSKFMTALCAIFVIAFAPQALAQSYAVIVNNVNSFSGDETAMKQQVKRLFLKQSSAWQGGTEVRAFDRAKGSPETTAFISDVLGMDEAAVARHWLSLKQKTGETPPRNVSSSNMLVKLVSKYEGGVGVVDSTTASALPDGVRVLFNF